MRPENSSRVNARLAAAGNFDHDRIRPLSLAIILIKQMVAQ
jgi:hypothetical protein